LAATILISVHSTKLLYATILRALAIWGQIRHRRAMLADMLPAIATQWDVCKQVLAPAISHKVAVTSSLSKDEKVPDETRVPASVEITAGTVRLMNALASSLGLTLSGVYVWDDAAAGFREGIANWAAVAGVLCEIEQLAADLTLHRAFAADLYTDQTEQRTPGQLAVYPECDAPLADSLFCATWNRAGLMAGFGSLYLGWLTMSVEALAATAPPAIEDSCIDVTGTPADDPDDPGAYTRYPFAATAGWSLAGAVIAARPSLDAPAEFYSAVTYAGATAGYLRLAGLYTDPDMPAAIEFRLLLIRTAT